MNCRVTYHSGHNGIAYSPLAATKDYEDVSFVIDDQGVKIFKDEMIAYYPTVISVEPLDGP